MPAAPAALRRGGGSGQRTVAHRLHRVRQPGPPGVVWFGEMLPAQALERAERAARQCSVMLVVGTSGAVWPAAGLASAARRAGAWVAIVNPNESEIDDDAHLVLRGSAAHLLPRCSKAFRSSPARRPLRRSRSATPG